MIYKLYYTDFEGQKRVRSVDDIHEYHVWQVSQIWGTAMFVVVETDTQPDDAAEYQEVVE